MTTFLRDLLLIAGMFISLAVLPPYLDSSLEKTHARLVDCDKPLEVGKGRVRYVIADGREKIKCKTHYAESK